MTTPEQHLRVVVVDDQRLVRSGFAMMLSAEDDITVVGEAADGAAGVALVRALNPDVVLMDVQMPVLDGIEATRQIVADGLAKVIILTTFDRDDYLFSALEAGASGFLLKNTDPDVLADGVRAVGLGHALLAPEVTKRVIAHLTRDALAGTSDPSDPSDPSGTAAGSTVGARDDSKLVRLDILTAREREVFELVGRGLSNSEIAEHLVVGEATVKTHVSSCLAKLGLRDRVQAVVLAYETGLIQPEA